MDNDISTRRGRQQAHFNKGDSTFNPEMANMSKTIFTKAQQAIS